jgi:hypothetical protein
MSAMPLTAAGMDKTKRSSFQNRIAQFFYFEQELLAPCSIHVPTHLMEEPPAMPHGAQSHRHPLRGGDYKAHVGARGPIVRLREVDAEGVHLIMEICEGGELLDRIFTRGHYIERATTKLARTIIEVV